MCVCVCTRAPPPLPADAESVSGDSITSEERRREFRRTHVIVPGFGPVPLPLAVALEVTFDREHFFSKANRDTREREARCVCVYMCARTRYCCGCVWYVLSFLSVCRAACNAILRHVCQCAPLLCAPLRSRLHVCVCVPSHLSSARFRAAKKKDRLEKIKTAIQQLWARERQVKTQVRLYAHGSDGWLEDPPSLCVCLSLPLSLCLSVFLSFSPSSVSLSCLSLLLFPYSPSLCLPFSVALSLSLSLSVSVSHPLPPRNRTEFSGGVIGSPSTALGRCFEFFRGGVQSSSFLSPPPIVETVSVSKTSL